MINDALSGGREGHMISIVLLFFPIGKGRTPLMLATHNNRKKLVRNLLRNGADPDIRDNDNKKALHYTEPDTK